MIESAIIGMEWALLFAAFAVTLFFCVLIPCGIVKYLWEVTEEWEDRRKKARALDWQEFREWQNERLET